MTPFTGSRKGVHQINDVAPLEELAIYRQLAQACLIISTSTCSRTSCEPSIQDIHPAVIADFPSGAAFRICLQIILASSMSSVVAIVSNCRPVASFANSQNMRSITLWIPGRF